MKKLRYYTTIMPVKAIPKASIARNGVGAFVKPCYRVTVQYCNWGGSSQGVRDLLSDPKQLFQRFAGQNKETVFEIVKKNGHPQLMFHYNNGSSNAVDVRNKDAVGVTKTLQEHLRRSGNALFKFNHKVMSNNESVRGVWSPLHVAKEHRHKI